MTVDAIPGGGDAALLGPPDRLLWVIRAGATGAEIGAAMDRICELVACRSHYHVPVTRRHAS